MKLTSYPIKRPQSPSYLVRVAKKKEPITNQVTNNVGIEPGTVSRAYSSDTPEAEVKFAMEPRPAWAT